MKKSFDRKIKISIYLTEELTEDLNSNLDIFDFLLHGSRVQFSSKNQFVSDGEEVKNKIDGKSFPPRMVATCY
jgi:hypothetical protein